MLTYYKEFPVRNMKDFAYYANLNEKEQMKPTMVLCMDYGRNFSGPKMDVFGEGQFFTNFYFSILGRGISSPDKAYMSNYMHPWVHLFNHVPKDLSEATYVHHVLEDSTYVFDGPVSHHKPLEMTLDKFISGVKLHIMKSEL